jgi:hypothetical protein
VESWAFSESALACVAVIRAQARSHSLSHPGARTFSALAYFNSVNLGYTANAVDWPRASIHRVHS